MSNRRYDVVVYGATGFTGRQTAAYLSRPDVTDGGWAVAGRDRAKPERLAGSLPGPAPDVLVADAADLAALARIAAQAKVVISLAGPYAPHGDALVDQCVDRGTHYVDLCGEDDVIGRRIRRLHERARARQVRVIPSCGYESVPFDLGVLVLDRAFRQADGSRVCEVDVEIVLRVRGGLLRAGSGTSGGTFATIRAFADSETLTDPFALAGERQPDARIRAANEANLSARTSATGDWLAPAFPDPFLNGAVIHRTNALLAAAEPGGGYAPELVYREAMNTSRSTGSQALGRLGAHAVAGSMRRIAAMSRGRSTPADRLFLTALNRLAPRPGKGPAVGSLDRLDYHLRFEALSTGGRHARATIHGRGNPGYRSSPNIIAQAALGLARNELPALDGGVLTPATGLGARFLDRFPAAGLTVSVTAA